MATRRSNRRLRSHQEAFEQSPKLGSLGTDVCASYCFNAFAQASVQALTHFCRARSKSQWCWMLLLAFKILRFVILVRWMHSSRCSRTIVFITVVPRQGVHAQTARKPFKKSPSRKLRASLFMFPSARQCSFGQI